MQDAGKLGGTGRARTVDSAAGRATWARGLPGEVGDLVAGQPLCGREDVGGRLNVAQLDPVMSEHRRGGDVKEIRVRRPGEHQARPPVDGDVGRLD